MSIQTAVLWAALCADAVALVTAYVCWRNVRKFTSLAAAVQADAEAARAQGTAMRYPEIAPRQWVPVPRAGAFDDNYRKHESERALDDPWFQP
jgi:hypothetical protein